MQQLFSKSLKPYNYFLRGMFAIIIIGLLLNSSTIGSLLGMMSAQIVTSVPFVFIVSGIYFIRRPLMVLAATTLIAIAYQLYLGTGMPTLEGTRVPSHPVAARVLGGLFIVSIMGAIESALRSVKSKSQP